MIKTGPTGRIATGSVLDCAKGPLEQALKFYDPCLYVKWNPKKLKGWGCWEIRRRPEEKQVVESVSFGGATFSRVEYKEYDMVHHVMDLAYLNYNALEKLKAMDTWSEGRKGLEWVKQLDYREAKAQERIEAKASVEREYNLKQLKPQIKDLMDFVSSGGNPARLADHWSK